MITKINDMFFNIKFDIKERKYFKKSKTGLYKGTCQYCGRNFKVASRGESLGCVSSHSHIASSIFKGRCKGSRDYPMQLSTMDTEDLIAELRKEVADMGAMKASDITLVIWDGREVDRETFDRIMGDYTYRTFEAAQVDMLPRIHKRMKLIEEYADNLELIADEKQDSDLILCEARKKR